MTIPIIKYSQKFTVFFSGLLYLALYHWIYVDYVNPLYEYAHHYYYDRDLVLYFYAYTVALLPLIFYCCRITPSGLGVSILYVLCYAPAQLTIVFMWTQSIFSYLLTAFLLAVSMSTLFVVAGMHGTQSKSANSNLQGTLSKKTKYNSQKKIRIGIFCFAFVSLIVVIIENWSHMRFVGFDQVYELRFEANDTNINIVAAYLGILITSFFSPYFSADALSNKNVTSFAYAALFSIVGFMANGSKIALLIPFSIVCFWFVLRKFHNVLFGLLGLGSIGIIVCLLIDAPEFALLKAIYIIRTLAVTGWSICTYYDFFIKNGLTYYTHIGPIKFLTDAYPYGEYSMGQMIGMEYSGSYDANFNAGFWASDGIASIGLFGIIPVTFILCVYLYTINKSVKASDSQFYSLWLTGFWMVLLNTPLTTAFLSGGGLLVLLIIFLGFQPHFFTRKMG